MSCPNRRDHVILDLPNEILFLIFGKLNMVDVLYSLVDVNERFTQLILDSFYIRHLDMTIKPYFEHTFSIDDHLLDKICKSILPRIHHQINHLVVEQEAMERILHTIKYPQLHSLSLVDFEEERLLQCLKGDSILQDLLTIQITHLDIDIRNSTIGQESKTQSHIFTLILSSCKRLSNLNFCQLFDDRNSPIRIFNQSLTSCMSSSLTTLKVYVATFDDCLYLLEGRLDHLSTLIINVEKISYSSSSIGNTVKLPKLKHFALISIAHVLCYDERIVPLLRRMINLEELSLSLSVTRVDSTYVDGTQLYEVLIYMPRLNKFTFSINTGVVIENMKFDLPSNDDIQRSFIGKEYGQIGSYCQTNMNIEEGRCHVYSLPYQFSYFLNLNNSFQGGKFAKVRWLTMNDIHPFEHEFFELISQDFGFLEYLCILNDEPQKNKGHSSRLIVFRHLSLLNLVSVHADYIEQFLLAKNTYLPCLTELCIEYQPMATVTENFTIDAMHFNCTKVMSLCTNEPFVRPNGFHQYFPLL